MFAAINKGGQYFSECSGVIFVRNESIDVVYALSSWCLSMISNVEERCWMLEGVGGDERDSKFLWVIFWDV